MKRGLASENHRNRRASHFASRARPDGTRERGDTPSSERRRIVCLSRPFRTRSLTITHGCIQPVVPARRASLNHRLSSQVPPAPISLVGLNHEGSAGRRTNAVNFRSATSSAMTPPREKWKPEPVAKPRSPRSGERAYEARRRRIRQNAGDFAARSTFPQRSLPRSLRALSPDVRIYSSTRDPWATFLFIKTNSALWTGFHPSARLAK